MKPAAPTPAMSLFKRSFAITLLAVLGLWIAFASGYIVRAVTQPPAFGLLNRTYNLLTQQGLKEPPPAPRLEYGMIQGMLAAYDDPYTLFVEPAQHELESNRLQGSFGGIGVSLEYTTTGAWLLYPTPDGPAAQAGVQDGDQLLTVDSLPITSQTPLDTIQSAVRGKVGERVTIQVQRSGEAEPLEFRIPRAQISLPSVSARLAADAPTVGVIKVSLIAASTAGEVETAVKDLQAKGARQFVLDLRDNPGGLLDGGVDVARLFLKEGVVMQQQYRGKAVESFRVEKVGPLADLPLAILINQGSASAAEIVAGALQAQQRAPLFGTASYGKDTIQLVYDLEDGSSLHLTAAHWWIPGLDQPLSGKGLTPDYPVPPPAPTLGNEPQPDFVLHTAVDWLQDSP